MRSVIQAINSMSVTLLHSQTVVVMYLLNYTGQQNLITGDARINRDCRKIKVASVSEVATNATDLALIVSNGNKGRNATEKMTYTVKVADRAR